MDACGHTSDKQYDVQKHEDTAQKWNLTPFESNMDSKHEAKKLQLLSLDGWENYQKELTRLCFEFWEVNEKQVQSNNSLRSDMMREPTEIQLPTSLFTDEHNNNEITVGLEPKVSLDNNIIPEELKNSKCVEIDGNVFRSKHEDDSVIRRFSRAINNNIDWQTYGNCSKTVDFKDNERHKRKILKRFSFYKHSNKQVKPNNKQQSLTFDGYSSCTLKDWRKCKKWLDTVERVKKHNSNASVLSDNIEENVEKTNADGRSDDTSAYNYTPDVEAKQMERKVDKLVKSINERDKLSSFANVDVDERTAAKRGPSDKFRHYFKNAFRANDDELDAQLLNDYTEHVNRKLNAWRTLSDRLDDVRRRTCGRANDAATAGGTWTDGGHDASGRPGSADGAYGGVTAAAGRKKYNVFRLLNRTGRSADVARAATTGCPASGPDGNGVRCGSEPRPGRMRKSLSDTDVPSTAAGSDWATTTAARLREDRQQCFRAVAARLEYVGGTLRGPRRLPGLRALCHVDALAGFGRPAEAVDLFVRAALPLSDDPDLMVRKAEAAYDWRFFCHLSMWRHSYKE